MHKITYHDLFWNRFNKPPTSIYNRYVSSKIDKGYFPSHVFTTEISAMNKESLRIERLTGIPTPELMEPLTLIHSNVALSEKVITLVKYYEKLFVYRRDAIRHKMSSILSENGKYPLDYYGTREELVEFLLKTYEKHFGRTSGAATNMALASYLYLNRSTLPKWIERTSVKRRGIMEELLDQFGIIFHNTNH